MTARGVTKAYDPSGDVNLAGFGGSMAVYGAGVAGLLALGRATGHALPESFSVRDVLLGGVATHKFSRLVAKGSVTSPIRSPFTEFSGPAGPAEHEESPVGARGLRHTIGELLTCPFCLGVWVGTAYTAGLVTAPRAARTWAAVFAVVAISDGLHHFYDRLRVD